MLSIPVLIKIVVVFSLVVVATAKHVHVLAARNGRYSHSAMQGLDLSAIWSAALEESFNRFNVACDSSCRNHGFFRCHEEIWCDG